MRTERDSFGPIEVPDDRLWGAQTARSLQFFAIGAHRMPAEIVRALAWIKWAAAGVNRDLGRLDANLAGAIEAAALEVAQGGLAEHFPLSVFQTGSGTQTNMNVNEVIANRASQLLGAPAGEGRAVHPNDHVNRGQSSNDAFPAALHVAALLALRERLSPALDRLHGELAAKARAFAGIVKVGRTHLQDATPVTLGQEFGGYAAQLALAREAIEAAAAPLHRLAIGGTAVGTGLNTHKEFGARVAARLAQRFGAPFAQAENLFAAMAGHEPVVAFHGALKALACALFKIANDVRWLASGPRAGLGEISLPENEPGSSIMPGKVNPTQSEALTMLAVQVMGHDAAIGFAASQGAFELNVFKPVIAFDLLDSIALLSDGMDSFARHCVAGIRVNADRIADLLERSLMLVTALAPHIGYDRAAQIAKHAHANGLSLREAALALGHVGAEDFDRWVRPERMLAPED